MDRVKSDMTALQLEEWRQRHSYTWNRAATALGISHGMLGYYLDGSRPIPMTVALLCRAIDRLSKARFRDAARKREKSKQAGEDKMFQGQKFVQMVRAGTSFQDALARSPVVGEGSFEGITFYYMRDGSRVWKAYKDGGLGNSGAIGKVISACCAPPSRAPRPRDYRQYEAAP